MVWLIDEAAHAVFDGTSWQITAVSSGGDMSKATYDGANIAEQLVGVSASQTLTNKTINASNNTISNISLSSSVTGILPAANGGTGVSAPGASGNVLTSNGTAWVSAAPAAGSGIVVATAQATTSGTAKDFTSLPAGIKLFRISLNEVSTNGASSMIIQLGDSGGIEATGYLGASSQMNTAVTSSNFTTGAGMLGASAGNISHGVVEFTLLDSTTNTWSWAGFIAQSNGAQTVTTAGSKSLSDVLTQVRFTTVGGTDSFDLGKVGLQYQT